jgi:hypothetical protein
MKLYIAYGSNLNIDQMKRRCPDAEIVTVSVINNYQLTFRGNHRGFGVANIEPKKGGMVPVGVWQISQSDEVALDRYEGYPHLYVKQNFMVEINGERHKAMAYVMHPGFDAVPPSDSYLQTIVEGFDDFHIDKAVLWDGVCWALKRSSESRASVLEAFAHWQVRYHWQMCPRCGRATVKPRTATNALSRHADGDQSLFDVLIKSLSDEFRVVGQVDINRHVSHLLHPLFCIAPEPLSPSQSHQ